MNTVKIITERALNADNADKVAGQLPYFGPTVQNDVTASRALDTVYQNTTGKVMTVTAIITSTIAANFYGVTGANNPPTLLRFKEAQSIGWAQTVAITVFPNQYYTIYID